MGLGEKLIGALFKYGGEGLDIVPGSQVEITARGGKRPISAKPITSSQVEEVLAELAPPGDNSWVLDGRSEFTYGTPNGLVRVVCERHGSRLRVAIRPDTGAPEEPEPERRPIQAQAELAAAAASASASSPAGLADSAVHARPAPTAPKSAPSAPRASAASARTQAPSMRPGAPAIERYLITMHERGASDLHLNSGNPPLYRLDGDIVTLDDDRPLSADAVKELLLGIMPERNQKEFEETNDTDFAYEIDGVARFRCNIFMDRKGWGGVFRNIPVEILTAEQLKLSPHILDLCNLSKGMVIVTGPTGSGKSTTLAAMVDYINRKRQAHIITIEDPVEFVHDNKQCLINQREVGIHTQSFKRALRAALREDPDIVLVGEMRDLETISIAIETAETGHLVFGTLHTSTAPSTVDRIIDQFPADEQAQIRTMLSESLKAVIAQTLCKKVGGGRIAALEVLMVTPPVANLIREGKTFQIPSAMQTGKNVGMVTLNDALVDLVTSGKVTADEAYIRAVAKSELKNALKRKDIEVGVG